jgi:regulator of nucleoside diphosphate kinase
MSHEIIDSNKRPIILTTGIYDLVKDHIRRKKVTPLEEEILKYQLKNAKQVTRRELPADVVTIDSRVFIKEHTSGQLESFVFVAPDKVKKKNNTHSILSPIGLALVGCKSGDFFSWAFEDGIKQIEVLKVERFT